MPDKILQPLAKAEKITPVGNQPEDDMIGRYYKNPILNKAAALVLGADADEEIDVHSPRAGLNLLGAMAGVGGLIKGAKAIGAGWKAADEAMTPIASDLYGLSEAPYGRRQFFYRASGAPKKAAILRKQASPGIIANIADKFDQMKGAYDLMGKVIKQPGGGIAQQGKILGALENEADTIAALHKKHGVLNDNLGTVREWDEHGIPQVMMKNDSWNNSPLPVLDESAYEDLGRGHRMPMIDVEDSREISRNANPVYRLWDNMSQATRQKRGDTLRFLNRTVPRNVVGVSPEGRAGYKDAMDKVAATVELRREPSEKLSNAFNARTKAINERTGGRSFYELSPEESDRILQEVQALPYDREIDDLREQLSGLDEANRVYRKEASTAAKKGTILMPSKPDNVRNLFQKALIEYDTNKADRMLGKYAEESLNEFGDSVGGVEGELIRAFIKEKIGASKQNVSDEVMDSLAQQLGFELKDINPAAAARLAQTRKSAIGSAVQGYKNRFLKPLPPEKK